MKWWHRWTWTWRGYWCCCVIVVVLLLQVKVRCIYVCLSCVYGTYTYIVIFKTLTNIPGIVINIQFICCCMHIWEIITLTINFINFLLRPSLQFLICMIIFFQISIFHFLHLFVYSTTVATMIMQWYTTICILLLLLLLLLYMMH